ncbi:MAG: GrdX protein [Clostridiales bacterium]|nr:GrdX protein [Clostridiales bacterium]
MIDLLKNMKIITNNSYICELFNEIIDVIYIKGGYLDVLYAARDKIHLGDILVSHPLMGSLKPNETPYRSILLDEKKGPLCYQSLSIIESSIESYKKLAKDNPTPQWSEKVLKDFQLLDAKFIESALSSLGISI